MSERVWLKGYCPNCHGATLYVGNGGYVTCSWRYCARPDAAANLMAEWRHDTPLAARSPSRTEGK